MKKHNQVTIKLDRQLHEFLLDVCEYEARIYGEPIDIRDLIIATVKYVFEENRRMRECFRRQRKMHRGF